MNDITTTPVAATPAPENTFTFPIPNTKGTDGNPVQMQVDLASIPAETRMDFLRKALVSYVVNSTNQENVRVNKANAPFDAYDAAQAADPLQTAVPKPEGERKVADLLTIAAAARTRLYEGKIKKMGEPGERKAKQDPVQAAITQAVLRDLFDKTSATTPGYKWTDAVKEVGGNGLAYLETKIAALVASGQDEATLRKALTERYINPAEMMYGKRETKNTKDVSLL